MSSTEVLWKKNPLLCEVLPRYFRVNVGRDNMPILARPTTGREHGRFQLAKVMKDLGYRNGVEIGVGEGISVKIWCQANPDLSLVVVEPFYYEEAQERMKRFAVKLLRMTSMEAVDQFEDASVDFVNIDGNHEFDFVAQDLIRWVPKVRIGGLVMVHDYCNSERNGVVKAVDAYTHCHRIDPWYVTQDCNPTAFWERGSELA